MPLKIDPHNVRYMKRSEWKIQNKNKKKKNINRSIACGDFKKDFLNSF